MIKSTIAFASLLLAAAALLWAPPLHAALLVVNFVFQLLLLIAQWFSARSAPPKRPTLRKVPHGAFVSIHVPAYNEPPEVLIETLRTLDKLDWNNYEVLVIDNNTKDENVWRPVEAACAELGPKFRFFHVDKLAGFKAGAMNYVRRFMDPRTDVILVVDADYQLDHNAIERGLLHFTSPEVALVQFPQAYRNIGTANAGINLEFHHFFSSYMNMASRLDCVPSTGTLSFIRATALRDVGGFDEEVVTEDSELGLRFNLEGYRTVYVHETIGRGLMPFDLESLKKQRWRWAFGNAQILKRNLSSILFSPNLSLRQKVGCLTHLSAWFNFNLLPSLSLLLLASVAAFGELSLLQSHLVPLAGFTLASFAVVKLGIFYLTLQRDGHPFQRIFQAYWTHLGLGLIFAFSWMKCLINDRAPFVRTNKFLSQKVPSFFRYALPETLLGTALLASSMTLIATDFVLGPAGALLMGCGRFAIFWVNRQMQATERLSASSEMPNEPSVTEPVWVSSETTSVA